MRTISSKTQFYLWGPCVLMQGCVYMDLPQFYVPLRSLCKVRISIWQNVCWPLSLSTKWQCQQLLTYTLDSLSLKSNCVCVCCAWLRLSNTSALQPNNSICKFVRGIFPAVRLKHGQTIVGDCHIHDGQKSRARATSTLTATQSDHYEGAHSGHGS